MRWGCPRDPDNLYLQTVDTMLTAAEMMELPHEIQLILAQPKERDHGPSPVRMDNGSSKLFKGYRVQHNNAIGPYKGGCAPPGRAPDDVKPRVPDDDEDLLVACLRRRQGRHQVDPASTP